ncbi:MAG: class I SAM-dependent rRNA methyltransferase [Solobacterium sp.]|nr:class I SAM-dependent rRNA methyltransferase [Solobacterium sp.]MCH4205923.1 class I SAM-dependent rRNA methyltransferase [Solobacterium sp.]MCH4226244.1 class I SAM-dependent rRNA methyltransferase [Solobacterium sp.]MCH4282711.1 class I SAM-dependent rRNA methyltransferase [Solobacterium sp.]
MTDAIVKISDQGASFLKQGQMWMYVNNLASSIDALEDGCQVSIETLSGAYLGTGLLSKQSHITVRIFSKQHEEIDQEFFAAKIRKAWAFRKTVEPRNLDNCRVIFGEADGLPGLTVDRYNHVLVSQITCFGLEKRKELLYDALLHVLQEDGQDVQAVYERNDVPSRTKEGLELYKGFYGEHDLPTETIIHENGLALHVDFENGQKTGYFLDQKSNRVLVRNIAKGKKVCDCFTHTGGFALNAAMGGAAEAVGVDVSASALEEARANAKLNDLNNVRFIQADVFDYLDTLKPNEYDLIILDPPAFTKSRKTVMKAYNGYKRINLQAMHVLKGGGYLVTCSCSRYMETELFEKMLREAAQEAGVTLKQVSVTQQNADHPILWTMEESSYLKFFIFQIL